jgi:hypothetical protein
MPKGKDLGLEHGSIPETLRNRIEQREKDRDHGIRTL